MVKNKVLNLIDLKRENGYKKKKKKDDETAKQYNFHGKLFEERKNCFVESLRIIESRVEETLQNSCTT